MKKPEIIRLSMLVISAFIYPVRIGVSNFAHGFSAFCSGSAVTFDLDTGLIPICNLMELIRVNISRAICQAGFFT